MKFPPFLKVYGDQSFRGDCPKEAYEQITFFNRLRREYPDCLGRIATHIKNEGKKSQNQVQKDKMMGLTKGASDIMIPGNPSFILELKIQDHTRARWSSKNQVKYLEIAHNNGAFVCLALGRDAAWEALQDWIKINKTLQKQS